MFICKNIHPNCSSLFILFKCITFNIFFCLLVIYLSLTVAESHQKHCVFNLPLAYCVVLHRRRHRFDARKRGRFVDKLLAVFYLPDQLGCHALHVYESIGRHFGHHMAFPSRVCRLSERLLLTVTYI